MKFILTNELGRLTKWLRIMGFDAEYFQENKEPGLVIKALQEDRVILTRNVHLGEHAGIRKLQIKSNNVFEQLNQAIQELSLKINKEEMFSRCTICNEALVSVEKEKVKDSVPEYVGKIQEHFFSCPRCKRIYWQGSHWGNAEKTLKEIL